MPRSFLAGTGSPAIAARTFAILTGAGCAMTCLMAYLPAAGHDQMWLLYAARLMLGGRTLYGPEIFESNPPLIVWLSAIPETLAHWLALSDTAVGKLLVTALVFSVGVVCLRLRQRLRQPLTSTAVWALVLTWVIVFGVFPVRDFGQRDYLLTLLVLPYLCAAAIRAQGGPLNPAAAWLIGAVALSGLALKPQQGFIPVAVEVFFLSVSPRPARSLVRPEILSMLATGVAYLAAVALFAPLYLSVVVPVVHDVYWAYGHLSWPALVGQSIQLHGLAACLGVLLLRTGWRRASPLVRIFTAAGVGALLGFYLQGTGWYYQQLPALSFFAIALTLLLLELSDRHLWYVPRSMPAAAAMLSVLAVALTAYAADLPFTAERSFPISQPDPSLFAGLPGGTPVMTVSPSVDDVIQPLFKYHLTLAQRYPHFLLLPAILRSEDPVTATDRDRIPPGRLAELEQLQHVWMVEDLERWQPTLILIERCDDPAVACQELEDRHADLLAFFLRDPAFRPIFARYHLWHRTRTYDAYRRD